MSESVGAQKDEEEEDEKEEEQADGLNEGISCHTSPAYYGALPVSPRV